jgi:hypothetical protein
MGPSIVQFSEQDVKENCEQICKQLPNLIGYGNHPLLFKGLAVNCSAVTKWDEGYLAAHVPRDERYFVRDLRTDQVKKMTMQQFQGRYKSEPLYMVSGSIHGEETQREHCPIDDCARLKRDLEVVAGDQTHRQTVWEKLFESVRDQTTMDLEQERTSFWYCNGAAPSGPHESAGRRLPIVTRTHRDAYYTTTVVIGTGHKDFYLWYPKAHEHGGDGSAVESMKRIVPQDGSQQGRACCCVRLESGDVLVNAPNW